MLYTLHSLYTRSLSFEMAEIFDMATTTLLRNTPFGVDFIALINLIYLIYVRFNGYVVTAHYSVSSVHAYILPTALCFCLWNTN